MLSLHILSLSLHVHKNYVFFPNRLRVHCPLPLSTLSTFPKDKDIHLYNHVQFSKSENFTLIHDYYLIYRPYANFISCPSNVVYSNFFPSSRSNLGSHVTFSFHIPLFSFDLDHFLFLFCLSWLTFLKSTGLLICRINLRFGFISDFLVIGFRLCFLGGVLARSFCSLLSALY